MADFCKECSTELFGEDFRGLAGLAGLGPTLLPGEGYHAICEGCGFIRVNDYGECLGDSACIRKHPRKWKVEPDVLSEEEEDRVEELAQDMIRQGGIDIFCYEDARAMVWNEHEEKKKK